MWEQARLNPTFLDTFLLPLVDGSFAYRLGAAAATALDGKVV